MNGIRHVVSPGGHWSIIQYIKLSGEIIIVALPEEFEAFAYTENCPIATFKHKSKPIFGIQWHREVARTENGVKMLRNFILIFVVAGRAGR